MARPIKVDPADGPCEYCEEWSRKKAIPQGAGRPPARRCDMCGEAIGCHENMGGLGYEAQSVHHMHLEAMSDKPVWMPKKMELCLACYRKDFAAVYPNEPLPV